MEEDVRVTQWNSRPCLASKTALRLVVFEWDNLGAHGSSAGRGEEEARTCSPRAERPRSTHVKLDTRIAGKSLKKGGFISSSGGTILSAKRSRTAANSILKRVLAVETPRSLSSASYRLSMWYLSAFSAW